MNKIRYITVVFILIGVTIVPDRMQGQHLNDMIMNRPYSDMRPWHLGFSIGTQLQNMVFTHNGYITEDGETWFMEEPSYSPGFCVNGLIDFRLNDYFSLRFSPGMYFGNRNIKMIDTTNDTEERQNIKSTYVVIPVDLKFAALRYKNSRPYLVGGVMPAFDVSKKRSDYLKLKSTDFFLTVGFGCDFYLPYFKFIPELKFCFGMLDVLDHNRTDLIDDPDKLKYTQSLKKAVSQMVVLTFYFE